MTPQTGAKRRFRFTLRSLLAAVTSLYMLLGMVTAVYRLQAVKSEERLARADLSPYGGVYSMASAIHTGRLTQSWWFVTFLNHVEAVDLSPHNWSAMERRGKLLAVDDDALPMLHKFRRLRSLDLRDTKVTDGGVEDIAALRRLENLDIRGTQITNDGLRELQVALPHCEITR